MSFTYFTQYATQFKATQFPEPSESEKGVEVCKTIISKHDYVLNKFKDSVHYKLFLFAISKFESFVDFVEFPIFSRFLNLETEINNDFETSKLIVESVNKIKIALESDSKTVDISDPETIISNAVDFLNKFDISESKSHRAIIGKYTDLKDNTDLKSESESESESINYNDIIKNINSDLIDLEIPKFKGTAPINPSLFKRNTNEHDTQYKIKLNEYIIARTQYETESKAHIEKYKQYTLLKADLSIELRRLDEEYMEKMYKSLHESIDKLNDGVDEHDLYICKFIQTLDYDKILQIFEITQIDISETDIFVNVNKLKEFINKSEDPVINSTNFLNLDLMSKLTDICENVFDNKENAKKCLWMIKAVYYTLSNVE